MMSMGPIEAVKECPFCKLRVRYRYITFNGHKAALAALERIQIVVIEKSR